MADYEMTANPQCVRRTADGMLIPNDPNNTDRIEYEKWRAEGGVPDPYQEPAALPVQGGT